MIWMQIYRCGRYTIRMKFRRAGDLWTEWKFISTDLLHKLKENQSVQAVPQRYQKLPMARAGRTSHNVLRRIQMGQAIKSREASKNSRATADHLPVKQKSAALAYHGCVKRSTNCTWLDTCTFRSISSCENQPVRSGFLKLVPKQYYILLTGH